MNTKSMQVELEDRWRGNMHKILLEVCDLYGLTPESVCGKNRRKTLATARIVFAYRAKTEVKASLREVGDFLGGRPGSTVVYYLKQFKKRRMADKVIF